MDKTCTGDLTMPIDPNGLYVMRLSALPPRDFVRLPVRWWDWQWWFGPKHMLRKIHPTPDNLLNYSVGTQYVFPIKNDNTIRFVDDLLGTPRWRIDRSVIPTHVSIWAGDKLMGCRSLSKLVQSMLLKTAFEVTIE